MHGLQLLLTMLITVQFVVIVLHDLLDIPGWTNGTKVREVVGRKKLWLATAINAVFSGWRLRLQSTSGTARDPHLLRTTMRETRQVLPPHR